MGATFGPRKTLRIGVVGAGGIMRSRHLPALVGLANVKIVAVCNARRETGALVALEYGIPDVSESWVDMVERDDIDIIWIGAPPVVHASVTIAALQSGKHVFCQARMALSVEEGRAMRAAAQVRPDLVSKLCPAKVGMRGGRYFKKLLSDGYAGDLWHFRLVACSDLFADSRAPAHWRQRADVCGINALSVGVYAEILDDWLGAPSRLQAQMNLVIPLRGHLRIDVPDVIQAAGQWSNGILGTLECSAVAQFPPDATLTIYGRDGTLIYNFAKDQIFGARRGDPSMSKVPIPSQYDTRWTVEADFIDAIVREERSVLSFESGVRNLEFTEAVIRSAKKNGEPVYLPLP